MSEPRLEVGRIADEVITELNTIVSPNGETSQDALQEALAVILNLGAIEGVKLLLGKLVENANELEKTAGVEIVSGRRATKSKDSKAASAKDKRGKGTTRRAK